MPTPRQFRISSMIGSDQNAFGSASQSFSVKLIPAAINQPGWAGLLRNAIKSTVRKVPHAIEHVEMLSDMTFRVPRAGRSTVVQPSMWPDTDFDEIRSDHPWRRTRRNTAFKSLYDTAGVLAIGIDCPC
jgi:hypothetical protein